MALMCWKLLKTISESVLPETESKIQQVKSDVRDEPVLLKNESRFTEDMVQNMISISEEVDDALCNICAQRTFLPVEYMESLRKANYIKISLCDDCLVTESGHENCESNVCRRCQKVAEELDNREIVKKEFANGTLIIADNQKT